MPAHGTPPLTVPPRLNKHPSPNQGPRRNGLSPTLVVLHYTAMDSAEAALDRLCDPTAEVSAHYLICKTGKMWQLVEEDQRAWHAGAGSWAGQDDINSRAIGIELDNTGAHPFSEVQMAALEELLVGIMARWAIAPSGVIGHSDMAPGRKMDPGPRFDWSRLARQGLAAETRNVPGETADFVERARATGYTAEVDAETLLQAVRLRHRPFASGPLCADDVAVLAPLPPSVCS